VEGDTGWPMAEAWAWPMAMDRQERVAHRARLLIILLPFTEFRERCCSQIGNSIVAPS
jgi:hypothetical protein